MAVNSLKDLDNKSRIRFKGIVISNRGNEASSGPVRKELADDVLLGIDDSGTIILPTLTDLQMGALDVSTHEGAIAYNLDRKAVVVCDGVSWTNVGSGGGGGGGAVSSVFGRTGIITAQIGDYTADLITVTPTGNITSTTVQSALVELQTDIDTLKAAVPVASAIVSPASANAVGAVGVSTAYAREDHQHPAQAVSADPDNLLTVGTDGLHFFGGIPRIHVTNTSVNPVVAGNPTDAEIAAAVTQKGVFVNYTGSDVSTDPVLDVWYVDDTGTAFKVTDGKKSVSAPVPPSANDDYTKGFEVGSVWVDTGASTVYICTSANVAAATWVLIGGGTSISPGTIIPPASNDAIGATGTSTAYAREDHKHPAEGVSADINNLLTVGSDGLHFFGGSKIAHVTNTAVAPVLASQPTDSEILAAVAERGVFVYYTGTDVPTDPVLDVWYIDDTGNIFKATDGKKANTATTAVPTVNDDASLGYDVGSIWIETTSNSVYVCSDPSVGAAVWILVSGSSATAGSTIPPASNDAVGAVGVSTAYAREDHKHPAQGVSADINNLLTVGSDGLHFFGGSPYIHVTNTAVNPAKAFEPLDTEILAAVAERGVFVYYTGTDLPSDPPVDIWYISDAGSIFKITDANKTGVALNPPSVNDDASFGYSIGSLWIDTSVNDKYICVDNTIGAAVWDNLATGGGGATAGTAIPPASNDAIGAVGVSTAYAREDHKHPAQGVSADAGNMLAVGTDGLHFLDPGNFVPYVQTFLVTDWVAGTTEYTLQILAGNHQKGTTPHVEVHEDVAGTFNVVLTDVSYSATGDITLKVSLSPDGRFAGRAIVRR